MPDPLTATIAESTLPAGEAIPAAAAIVDQALPGFEPPPYDTAEALARITAQNRTVARAKAEWEAAKDEAATAKKVYDREVDTLSAIIRDADHQSRDADARQPYLRPVAEGVASSSCRYEQATGGPCPLCRVLRAAAAPLPDPEDTGHAEAVTEALARAADPEELRAELDFEADLDLPTAVVEGWSEDQRLEVALWLAAVAGLPKDANQPPRPAWLTGPSPEPTTDEVMAAAKVCLCQTPKGKKTCKTCGGTVTGAK